MVVVADDLALWVEVRREMREGIAASWVVALGGLGAGGVCEGGGCAGVGGCGAEVKLRWVVGLRKEKTGLAEPNGAWSAHSDQLQILILPNGSGERLRPGQRGYRRFEGASAGQPRPARGPNAAREPNRRRKDAHADRLLRGDFSILTVCVAAKHQRYSSPSNHATRLIMKLTSPAPLTGARSLRRLSSPIRCRALRPCSSFSLMIGRVLGESAFCFRTGRKPEAVLVSAARVSDSLLRLRALTGLLGLAGASGGHDDGEDGSASPNSRADEQRPGKPCAGLGLSRLEAVKAECSEAT